MPKAKQTDSGLDEPFVLKHRVAGAATLLFFSALVLPWMLGPASDPAEAEENPSIEVSMAESSSTEIENELLAEMVEQEPVQEEVYISKITPLDSSSLQLTESAEADKAEPDTDSNPSERTEREQKEKTQRAADLASDNAAKLAAEQKAAEQSNKAQQQAQQKQRQLAADKQREIEADLAAALSAETESNNTPAKVERGYVVQVGLYENKQGANRVVSDLRSKGFSPSTTVVDTNRGKNTGTRVWLGPFAQRVDAGKARSRLAELTGQGSFIREYP